MKDEYGWTRGRSGCEHTTGCITCSDEGIVMRVVAQSEMDGVVWCITMPGENGRNDDRAGALSEVMTGIAGPVAVGDFVLVHAGTALRVLPSDLGYESASTLPGPLT